MRIRDANHLSKFRAWTRLTSLLVRKYPLCVKYTSDCLLIQCFRMNKPSLWFDRTTHEPAVTTRIKSSSVLRWFNALTKRINKTQLLDSVNTWLCHSVVDSVNTWLCHSVVDSLNTWLCHSVVDSVNTWLCHSVVDSVNTWLCHSVVDCGIGRGKAGQEPTSLVSEAYVVQSWLMSQPPYCIHSFWVACTQWQLDIGCGSKTID